MTKRGHERAERVILSGFVGNRIRSFEFHADREIIAGDPPCITGCAGVPRSIGEPDELGQAAVARHEQVG